MISAACLISAGSTMREFHCRRFWRLLLPRGSDSHDEAVTERNEITRLLVLI